MALSFSTIKNMPKQKGGMRWRVVNITLDSSYPTGGEAVTASDFSLDNSIDVMILSPSGGYVFEFDSTNSKILAYYADYSASTDGPLIQVADTTDLSAVTVQALVFGD